FRARRCGGSPSIDRAQRRARRGRGSLPARRRGTPGCRPSPCAHSCTTALQPWIFLDTARRRIVHRMKTYRAVMLTKKGGPEVLERVELPLVPPGPGEVRVAVRATGAGGTDITMRRGMYPYAPPIPFVPGYEVVGDVEALG